MATDFFCPHCGAANPPDNICCSVCTYAFNNASPSQTEFPDSTQLIKQRYQIVTKLGQGGFGAVYKARDTQLQPALRAIKEIGDAQLNPQEKLEAIAAFQQEAHILAGLRHQNLPSIYDHFEEHNRWYLVMDYIEGETLDAILARSPQGKLPLETVLHYALQLCTVLNYLHSQDPPIIFRDLKPGNVMITRENHLYLIDFGIARFFKPGQTKDTIALGSPGYAAPEQYGKAQTTERADIYSLGATLHHILSGRDPSENPFIFPPLQLEPQTSGAKALADLVLHMVIIDKEFRPASIQAVKQGLQQIAKQDLSTPLVARSLQPQIPSSYKQRNTSSLLGPVAPSAVRPITSNKHSSQVSQLVLSPGSRPAARPITFNKHNSQVNQIAWSPNSRFIASGSSDSLQIWDPQTGQTHYSENDPIESLAWSPDGTKILGGSGKVWLFDIMSKTKIDTPISSAHILAWSPDGKYLATSSVNSRTIQIWSNTADTFLPIKKCVGHTGVVDALAWTPDSSHIISTSRDHTTRIWDATNGKLLFKHREPLWANYAVACSPDGKLIAIAGPCIELWDTHLRDCQRSLSYHSGTINSLAWSPDGRYLASGSSDQRVCVWDCATGKVLNVYQGHVGKVSTVVWSPDGARIASGGKDCRVHVWSHTVPQSLYPQRPRMLQLGQYNAFASVSWIFLVISFFVLPSNFGIGVFLLGVSALYGLVALISYWRFRRNNTQRSRGNRRK